MKQIQWFPGHMAKALNEMQKQIDVVDILIEIVDARIPFSSRNPELVTFSSKKPTLLIMSKKDLANDNITKKWIEYYERQNIKVIAAEINSLSINTVKTKCEEILKDKREKMVAKGLRSRPIRALVVGTPNVGKSSFINRMARRNATVVANKPGVTKASQYIKVADDFVLLDSPGVLWPNFEDKKVAINLALIGSIKKEILPLDFLVFNLINILTNQYVGTLSKNYKIEEIKSKTEEECTEILGRICVSRNYKKANDELDIDRAIMTLLKDFASSKLGKISLEEPING